ncbi:peptide/nickel transport system substrate-binding protein [Roseomonas rosea]|uniref:Peptide/nickel transport system substrate-binding protein n=1 Tax=Muricoccus roseus TaxID=198092 RepID=A0A1M6RHU4_9PROT|nr:ABC transporter substrate-binding protein [Roseomonas rosea]SHK32003.1 peptide/nickel transport system substrate-binding protein [Roseomonas rosea]
MLGRRHILGAAAAGLALPAAVRAAPASTLRFTPSVDLAFTDPIYATAYVTRNHALMVYDTLYGVNNRLEASPQMVEGHRIEQDGLRWEMKLRNGLTWHDGERVLARDCVASIRRWATRDAMGDALMQASDEISAADDRTIVLRLKRPCPWIPYALGKVATSVCAMMPERLVTDVSGFKPVTEVVGSGPFRFLQDERVPGAHNAYGRFERYMPRQDGVADWTSGPKIVHYDRVIWTTMPDAGTGVAALQAGEQDWIDTAPHDLLPVLKRHSGVRVMVVEPLGFTCLMQVNHLHRPFNSQAIRRALMGGIDQKASMQAVVGDNPEYMSTPLGFFTPGSPMANDAGMGRLSDKPDMTKVKRALAEAGYAGEKVVFLVPADSAAIKALCDVAADMMQQIGINLEYAATDFGSVVARRNNRKTVAEGGWSALAGNWHGMDWLNPASHNAIRGNPEKGFFGWPTSERREALRAEWMVTHDQAEQKRICRDLQQACFDEVAYFPLGQYLQPSAMRASLQGVMTGTPVFWNVRPA